MSHTPLGPGTLRLTPAGEDIAAEAWGPGADWMLEHAPDLVGIDDSPEDFRPPPGVVAEAHRRNRGLRLGRTARVWEALLPTIIGQKVTTKGAGRSFRALVRRYGETAPGPMTWTMIPSPEVIRSLDFSDLHAIGIERKRATILIEAARRATRLEEAAGMDSEAALRRLLAVRGVGPWTVGHVAGIALGDPDAVPIGDYHLPNTVAWVLAGEPRADDDRMLELLEPYRGHRRRAVLLIKRSGVNAPRYGPRLAVRTFADVDQVTPAGSAG